MKKFVLFQNSDTQRVTVQTEDTQETKTVLISKEWKKHKSDTEWIVGKGITFPQSELVSLGEILGCKSSPELDNLLSKYKVVESEENHE